jgi:hypothetical protein
LIVVTADLVSARIRFSVKSVTAHKPPVPAPLALPQPGRSGRPNRVQVRGVGIRKPDPTSPMRNY